MFYNYDFYIKQALEVESDSTESSDIEDETG